MFSLDVDLTKEEAALDAAGVRDLQWLPSEAGWVGRGFIAGDRLAELGERVVAAFSDVTTEARSLVLAALFSAAASGTTTSEGGIAALLQAELGPDGHAFLILLDDLEQAGWIEREVTTTATLHLLPLGSRMLGAAAKGRATVRWPTGNREAVPFPLRHDAWAAGPKVAGSSGGRDCGVAAGAASAEILKSDRLSGVEHTIEVIDSSVVVDGEREIYTTTGKGELLINLLLELIERHPGAWTEGADELAHKLRGDRKGGSIRAIFSRFKKDLCTAAGFEILAGDPAHGYSLAPGIVPARKVKAPAETPRRPEAPPKP